MITLNVIGYVKSYHHQVFLKDNLFYYEYGTLTLMCLEWKCMEVALTHTEARQPWITIMKRRLFATGTLAKFVDNL